MASAPKRARYLKPGEDDIGMVLAEERFHSTEDNLAGDSVIAFHPPNAGISIEQQRQLLPVFQWRSQFLYLLETNRVVVVVGETGSGKSTQLPQYLYEAGWLEGGAGLLVTQPRRIAAVTLAARIAEEKDWSLGRQVGYAIRFEDCQTPGETVITFMTDGMLIRELMRDPLMRRFRVVMLDEVHERSLHTDILIGLVKKVLRKRPDDLRLIVSSATLEADRFASYFSDLDLREVPSSEGEVSAGARRVGNCALLSVEGRQYPVDVHYSLDPVPCYVKAARDTVLSLHDTEPQGGDVLVFLTGQEEILQLFSELVEENRRRQQQWQEKQRNEAGSRPPLRMRVLPLYGNLPHRDQLRVFERPMRSCRKVVLSTNIAEASLTIPGIAYVVDCGFTKLRAYNSETGLEALVTVPVSKASADQRAGRAGRLRAGKVYRLYTEASHATLPDHTPAEILRADLSHAILQLKSLGIDNFVRFDFLSPPPPANMARAIELLYALGAIDSSAHLTEPVGLRMAELPLHPMAAAMLFAGAEEGCSQEAAGLAALLQIQNAFLVPSGQRKQAEKSRRQFSCEEGDHLSQLNALVTFERHGCNMTWADQHWLNGRGLNRALELREQLSGFMRRFDLPWVSAAGDADKVLRALVRGFFSQVARLEPGGKHYLTVRGNHVLHLHPNSVLFMEPRWPKWVLFTDVVLSSKEYMEGVSVIKPDWLYQLAPHYYRFGTEREHVERGLADLGRRM